MPDQGTQGSTGAPDAARTQLRGQGFAALKAGAWPQAADAGQLLLRANRQDSEGWLLVCLALKGMNSVDTLKAFGQAMQSVPPSDAAYPLLATEMANVLASRGRADEAAAVADRIAPDPRLTPRQRDVLSNAYAQAMLFEKALEQADMAVSVLPDDPASLYSRGLAHRHLGHLDEAEADFERVLQQDPLHGLTHFALADTRSWTDATAHIDRLKAARAAPGPEPLDKARICYALFKEAHDCKQTALAWDALSECNRIAAELNPDSQAERQASASSMIATFTGNLPAGPARTADSVTPVFVIGLPRSGTTLVERILSAHPDVTAMGETQFVQTALREELGIRNSLQILSLDNPRLQTANWESIAANYLRRTAYLRGDTPYFTEKLPQNYAFVGALRTAFPHARFVHVRRNPMDSLFGAYRILFAAGSYAWSYTLDGLASAYRDYRRLTDHWRQELGSDFVEITLETLIDNQDSEIRRLMTETGIGFDERCLSPHKADGGVSTASSVQVRRPINRSGVGTWRRYADELAPLLRALQADGFVDADGEAIWPAR